MASLNSKCTKCITALVIPQPIHSRLKHICDKHNCEVDESNKSAGKHIKTNGLTISKPMYNLINRLELKFMLFP